MRLDLFLKKNLLFFIRRDKKINSLEEETFLSLSRSFWQEMIKNGHIKYLQKKLKSSSRSDSLEKNLLTFDWKKIKKSWLLFSKENLIPYPIPLNFIKKNRGFYALNKPAGITINPISPAKTSSRQPSLLEGLLAYSFNEKAKIKIIHRLDKETSGVILFARGEENEDYFRRKFKNREVKKTYLALVAGDFPYSKFTLSGLLGKKANNPLLRSINSLNILSDSKKINLRKENRLIKPKKTVTFGKKITAGNIEDLAKHPNQILKQWVALLEPLLSQEQKRRNIYSLLELRPKTGRTHQLRVQLSFLSYPIVGDSLYGGSFAQKLGCQFLHALKIKCFNREGETCEASSSQIILSKNYFVIE